MSIIKMIKFCIFLLICSSTFAQNLTITDLNLRFDGENGEYTAQLIEGKLSPIRFKVSDKQFSFFRDYQKDELAFDFGTNDEFVVEKYSTSFLKDLSYIQLQNFNYNQNKFNSLRIKAPNLVYNNGDNALSFDNAQIICKNSNINEESDFFTLCLKSMAVTISKLNSSKGITSKLFAADENAFVDISSVFITINNNKLNAKLKVKDGLTVNVKIEGTFTYDKEQNKISLYLSKAKASGISIKSRILNSIKEKNMENVQVVGNSIIVQM